MNPRTIHAWVAALLAPLAAAHAAETPAPPKPNIIFVLFDDLGWPQVPAFRPESAFKMPAMDRLKREGMRFTDAHAAASVCTPTRYGVITGRYPMRIGQFGVLTTFAAPIIDPQRLTIGAMLQSAGYHTACFGKWHLGMNIQAKGKATGNELPIGTKVADSPVTRGFDQAVVYPEARDIGLLVGGDKVIANMKEVEVQPFMAKTTVAWLEEQSKQSAPFFLYLPLSTPHTPIVPAPEYAGKSGVNGKEKEYGDWIYEGDDVLGKVLDTLDRLHLADNTVIMVGSDNGAAGRIYPPLRACKTSIYEGGHREPFIARWPGHIKPASTCADTICLNDIMATCAALAGVTLPANAAEDSVSILPDLLGTATGPVREATVHQAPNGELAIRQGPWKLIFAKGGKRELYNMQTDLSETHDVVAENPAIVDKLTALMQHYIDTGRSTPGAAQSNEHAIQLDGRKPKKGKAAQKEQAEVRMAMDQNFD